jgi:hypothetical protein
MRNPRESTKAISRNMERNYARIETSTKRNLIIQNMNTYIFIHGGESFHSHEEYKKWITSTLVEWNSEAYSIREEKKKWKTELARKLIEE